MNVELHENKKPVCAACCESADSRFSDRQVQPPAGGAFLSMKLIPCYEAAQRAADTGKVAIAIVNAPIENAEEDGPYGYCPESAVPMLFANGSVVEVLKPSSMVTTLRIVTVWQSNGDFCRVGNFTSRKAAVEFETWAKSRGWKAEMQILGSLPATCSPDTYRSYYSE